MTETSRPTRSVVDNSLWRTRIRVATILGSYRQGLSVEANVQQFPPLKPTEVYDALAYAYDHIAEIKADVIADDESV